MRGVGLRIQNGTSSTGSYSLDFISAIQASGRMISTRILKGNTVYAEANINSCNIYWDANLFKSVMKCAEIEFNGIIPFELNDVLDDIQVGVSEDGGHTFYYVQYGQFTITEVTYDYEQGVTKVTSYDGMIKSMKPYALSITYSESYTNQDFINAVLSELGLTSGVFDPTRFPILSEIRNHETYNDSYTYRDVLDDFAEILGTVIYITRGSDGTDRLTVASSGTVTTSWFTSQLATLTKTNDFKKISKVVLSRGPQEDNVAYDGGGTGSEIKFINNQLVEGYADSEGVVDRTPYLQPIYSKCHSWDAYRACEFDTFGLCLFEPGDKLSIQDEDLGIDYIVYLSGNIKVTQGIKESGESSIPEVTETDYTKTTADSRQERETYLYVDKVNGTVVGYSGEISNLNDIVSGEGGLVSSVSTLSQNYATLIGDGTEENPGYIKQQASIIALNQGNLVLGSVADTYATQESLETTNSNVTDLNDQINGENGIVDTMASFITVTAAQAMIVALDTSWKQGIGTAFQVDAEGTKVYGITDYDATTGAVSIDQTTYTLTSTKSGKTGTYYYVAGKLSSWATSDDFGCKELTIGNAGPDEARWRTTMNANTLDDIYHT